MFHEWCPSSNEKQTNWSISSWHQFPIQQTQVAEIHVVCNCALIYICLVNVTRDCYRCIINIHWMYRLTFQMNGFSWPHSFSMAIMSLFTALFCFFNYHLEQTTNARFNWMVRFIWRERLTLSVAASDDYTFNYVLNYHFQLHSPTCVDLLLRVFDLKGNSRQWTSRCWSMVLSMESRCRLWTMEWKCSWCNG